MDILTQIENYQPYNEQEERDKGLILDCLRAFEDVFTRENALAHMTASAWVVNERFDRVLMAYHNLYDSWSWLGGHADGEEDLLAVALREVREESGVKNVRPASEDIFSLEVLTVAGHAKRGKYVSPAFERHVSSHRGRHERAHGQARREQWREMVHARGRGGSQQRKMVSRAYLQ